MTKLGQPGTPSPASGCQPCPHGRCPDDDTGHRVGIRQYLAIPAEAEVPTGRRQRLVVAPSSGCGRRALS